MGRVTAICPVLAPGEGAASNTLHGGCPPAPVHRFPGLFPPSPPGWGLGREEQRAPTSCFLYLTCGRLENLGLERTLKDEASKGARAVPCFHFTVEKIRQHRISLIYAFILPTFIY